MADARHRDSLAAFAGIDDTRPLLVERMTESSGGQLDAFMSEREDLGLLAICLVMVLLSIGGIVAAFLTELIGSLDGLLLLLVCAMMIFIFSPPLIALARELGWLPSKSKKVEKSAGKK